MLFSSFSQWLLCPLPCPPTPSLCVAFVQLVGGWVGFSFRAPVHPWCLPRNFLTLAHPYSLQNAPVSFAFFCPVLELPIPQGDWLLLLEIVLETKSRAPGVTLAWLPGPPSAEHRGLGTCAQLSRFLPVSHLRLHCEARAPADVSRRPSRVIQAPPPAPGSALGLGCPGSVRVCGRVTAGTWDPQEASASPEPRACTLWLCSCRRHHFQNAEGGASPCPFREEVSCIPLSQSAFFPGILQSTK